MVVAIDGPAGVGKSTLAVWIAEEFRLFNLNSGSFYRALALKVCDEGIDADDHGAVAALAEKTDLDIVNGRLRMDGIDVEDRLRGAEIDDLSSIVSAIVPVRHSVNSHLRRIAGNLDLVTEGRDMTTVVFPEAAVKIFLTADPAVRARRRFDQQKGRQKLKDIEKSIRERDHRDQNKTEGSLKIAKDSAILDTTALTFYEVCERVRKLISPQERTCPNKMP